MERRWRWCDVQTALTGACVKRYVFILLKSCYGVAQSDVSGHWVPDGRSRAKEWLLLMTGCGGPAHSKEQRRIMAYTLIELSPNSNWLVSTRSTRRTCRVMSSLDVTSQVEFWLVCTIAKAWNGTTISTKSVCTRFKFATEDRIVFAQ